MGWPIAINDGTPGLFVAVALRIEADAFFNKVVRVHHRVTAEQMKGK
jgi:hypothetical protein